MNTQFKKGVLDMCVLAVLSKGDSYGYDLAEELSSRIQIADGTVYPLLRKLASSGEVSTYLQESTSGPPRKYYSLTDKGRERLTKDMEEWKEFTAMVSGILGGEQ
ncbi:PadR family transcriptional regulator, regulatory protein PadR [Ruminococcaceae bacterium YRB3002]|nr:PadR family transcriptional regulator, regulatory protein PadR [Ruminococcaceae bacterium YRB3002]